MGKAAPGCITLPFKLTNWALVFSSLIYRQSVSDTDLGIQAIPLMSSATAPPLPLIMPRTLSWA